MRIGKEHYSFIAWYGMDQSVYQTMISRIAALSCWRS
jgi:hypothetical protein